MRTLYDNPTKNQFEESMLETFLSTFTEFKIERWEKSEAPDFILFGDGGTIGLEVTGLVHESLAKIRSAQDRCLRHAADLADKFGIAPLEVNVRFRDDHSHVVCKVAAGELVQFILDKLPSIDDSKCWNYNDCGLQYIHWIRIRKGTAYGQRWLSRHRFGRIHMNWMTVDPIDKIQLVIDKKSAKLKTYISKCDACWLLVGANEWTAPEAFKITVGIENHIFFGGFQRLFFLENIEGRLTELQIRT